MPTLQVAIDATRAKSGARQASAAMTQVRRSASRAAGQGGLATLSRQMGLTSSASFILRRHMFALSAALTGLVGIRQAIQTIGNFEKNMVTATTIMAVTVDEATRLSEVMRDLGVNTQFGAEQASKALVSLARANISTAEAMMVLPAAMDLATAAEMDLSRSTETLLSIMRQFRLPIAEAAKTADILVRASNDALTTVDDLMVALRFVGPFAKTAGLSLEETAAAMEVLANAGIRGSLAGVAMRGMLAALGSPSNKAIEQLEAIGLEIRELNPEANSLVEIFGRLAGVNIRASEASTAFTRRVASSAVTLAQFKDSLQQFITRNEDAAGASRNLASAIEATLPIALIKLKNAFAELFLVVGASGVGQAFENFIDTLTQAIVILAGSEARLESVTDSARTMADTIAGIGAGIATFALLKVGIAAAASAMTIFNFIVAANPIGLIVTSISAAIAALFFFRNSVISVGDRSFRVIDLMVATFEHMKDKVGFVLRTIRNVWVFVWDSLGTIITNAINGFSAPFKMVFSNWSLVLDQMVKAAKTVMNIILLIFMKLGETVASIFTGVIDAAKAQINIVATILADPFNFEAIGKSLTDAGSGLINITEDFLLDIGSIWGTGWERDVIGEAIKAIKVGVPALANAVGTALGDENFAEDFNKFFNPAAQIDDIFDRAEARFLKRQEELAKRGLAGGRDPAIPDFGAPEGFEPGGGRPLLTQRARSQILSFQKMVTAQSRLLEVSRSLNAEQERSSLLARAREMQAKGEGAITEKSIAALETIIRLRQEQTAQFQVEEILTSLRDERDILLEQGDAADRLNTILKLRRDLFAEGGELTAIQERALDTELRLQQQLEKSIALSNDLATATTDAMMAFIMGGTSARDAIKGLANELERLFLQTQLEPLTEGLANLARGFSDSTFGVGDAQASADAAGQVATVAAQAAALEAQAASVQAQAAVTQGFATIAEAQLMQAEALAAVQVGVAQAAGSVIEANVAAASAAASAAQAQAAAAGAAATAAVSNITPSRMGNVFQGGTLQHFAKGGIVNQRSTFPLSDGGTGEMSEQGPEGILPLKRTRDGSLGVNAEGLSGGTINHYHFYGVRDMDSFRRSRHQLAAGVTKDVSRLQRSSR